jgi:hypothetical protein
MVRTAAPAWISAGVTRKDHHLCAQPGSDMPRHHLYVLHHVGRAIENRGIDALKHILAGRIVFPERTEVGIVDQPGAEFFDRRERAGDREVDYNVFWPEKHAVSLYLVLWLIFDNPGCAAGSATSLR